MCIKDNIAKGICQADFGRIRGGTKGLEAERNRQVVGDAAAWYNIGECP